MKSNRQRIHAFTLIELSIVLVIIGLIVGGVLVGQTLIRQAAVSSTIAQVESYRVAVNTFRFKFNFLPGDIKDPDATNFGLPARGPTAGQGDGNGVIEGSWALCTGIGTYNWGIYELLGETIQLWNDLSTIKLINGTFPYVRICNGNGGPEFTATNLATFFPTAKIGKGNYIYAYSNLSKNYFGLSAVKSILNSNSGQMDSGVSLTVNEAYAIDTKLDDGKPQSGNVLARYILLSGLPGAAGGGATGNNANWPEMIPSSVSVPGSATTCYDNGGVSGTPTRYSVSQNNGEGQNCALSFGF